MDKSSRLIILIIRSSSALGVLLALLVYLSLQVYYWIPKNGFSFNGSCVNHFGESYTCSIIEWMLYGLMSPFAWPAIIVLIFLSCLMMTIFAGLLRSLLPSELRTELKQNNTKSPNRRMLELVIFVVLILSTVFLVMFR